MEGLTPGRNVHFVDANGDHLAAIVSQVYDGVHGTVMLHVFRTDYMRHPVDRADSRYDVSGDVPGTWHFIERA